MQIKTGLTSLLNIRLPIVMAPMFLVSNEEMMKCAMDSGIAGAFPTLNFRKEGELEGVLERLNIVKAKSAGTYGVNLIVQKSNFLYKKHLEICIERKVPFYITSLGNPREVVDLAHSYGAKVFCDVTNIEHAQKAHDNGCDGFVAVGQGAGGHAGPFPLQLLVPALHKYFPEKPVIAAGGIATGEGILSMIALGAAGVSIGTRFIACEEANVTPDYKNAVVNAHMKDIVMTTKISGTPCSIIDTEYAKKIGYTQNRLEKFLSKNPRTKKWFKMVVQLRGMRRLEASIQPANYHTLWCAGQSVELINDILPCREIISHLESEMFEEFKKLEVTISN
jgi:nitronate monooxygenase